MPIEQIDPKTAWAKMEADPASTRYLDVRTKKEFDAGHPRGAINVAIMERDASGQMTPNGNFVNEVCRVLGTDKTLVVGCMAGGRSQKACTILEAAGFANLANVQGGWGGAPGIPGWRDAGLPSEQ